MEGEEDRRLSDRRFRLFGIPIQTSFWFFPVMVGLGWIVSDFQFSVLPFFLLAMMIAVLAHEFAHALVGRWFGGRGPEIYLVFFGGLCAFRQADFTRWQALAMVLAGPLANLVLGGTAALVLDLDLMSGIHHFAREFLLWFWAINLVVGILNLLPVLPLDGGHILRLLLGRHRLHWVSMVGMLVGIAMVVHALQSRDYLLLALFGFLVWRNTGDFFAWWRMRNHA